MNLYARNADGSILNSLFRKHSKRHLRFSIFFAFIATFSILFGSKQAEADFPFTPNQEMTMGQLCDPSDSDFKEYRYSEKIPYCSRNVASSTKTQIYKDYGVPFNCRKDYTIDHFIPLSIGGSNSKSNLWPEHKKIKALRQNLEMQLYEDLRDAKLTQAQALDIVFTEKLNPPVEGIDIHSLCYKRFKLFTNRKSL
jgi:hypothetical protein